MMLLVRFVCSGTHIKQRSAEGNLVGSVPIRE